MRGVHYLSVSLSVLLATVLSGGGLVEACDVCGCAFNARRSAGKSTSGAMAITPTATTLGQGHGSVGFLFEAQRFNSIPADDAHALNEAGHDIHGKDHEEFYNLSVGYGLLDKLDVFLIAPIVSKTTIELEDEDRLGEKDRATGFGDLRLVGKYRFWEHGVDAALLLGVKAPTGETSDKKPSGQKFEPEQQPGSGSWDLMTGLAVSRSFAEHLTVASSFQYTTRGEGAQEEKLGDVFHYNLGISYALKPLGQHPNLSLLLELRNEWALRDHSREQDKVWDSGGTTILLSPGMSADLTPSLSAFWAMPIPIYQNLGGQHEELKYEVLTGFSWHF